MTYSTTTRLGLGRGWWFCDSMVRLSGSGNDGSSCRGWVSVSGRIEDAAAHARS